MSDKEKREGLALLAKEMAAYALRSEVCPHEMRREYLRRLEDLRKSWSETDREVEHLREQRAKESA